jgi:hypothetical protein
MSAIFKMADKTRHKNGTPPSFMKFCLVVPEICRGQVHGARKERRRIRRIRIIKIIIITRYEYFWGSKRVVVTIESYGKLEILCINVDNF